ncbi:MAG: alpha/beta hydrolase [Lewinellaceae bacterium]|nr:alpha/beta hydrolase [Lewinellaceae bacterium]
MKKIFLWVGVIQFLALSPLGCSRERNDNNKAGNCVSRYDAKELAINKVYGQEKHQYYDLYVPNGRKAKFPLVIYCHSGGFVTGSKRNDMATHFCKDLAREGFAVAAINYHLLTLSNGGYMHQKKGILMALEDLRTALEFFQRNEDDDPIDTDNIFLAGFSAGAMLALHAIFSDEDEVVDYFEADPNFQSEVSVRGVISIGGAMLDPTHIDDDEKTPVLLFHGEDDQIISLYTGDPFQKFARDYTMDFPVLYFELGITKKKGDAPPEDITFGGFRKIQGKIPKDISTMFINAVTPTVHGSGKVFDSLPPRSLNELVVIPKKGHTFMKTEGGIYNDDYCEMKKKTVSFIKNNLDRGNKRADASRRQRENR